MWRKSGRQKKQGGPLERGGRKLPAKLVGRRDYHLISRVNRLVDNM